MTPVDPKNPIRVLVVAPSLHIVGGQSRQAARLMERLKPEPDLQIGFLPHNPRLPGILRSLQLIKYVRTIVTTFIYIVLLLLRVPKYDIIHVFSASYYSYCLSVMPALFIARLYRKEVDLELPQRRMRGPSCKLADGSADRSLGH